MADRLSVNERLLPNQSLTSQNQRLTLIMQADSNLVLYQVGVKALWSTNTWTLGNAGVVAVMQDDGNLVLYLTTGVPVWATGTNSDANRNSILVLQDDGNLVIYRPGNVPIWASNTVVNWDGPVQASRDEEVGNQKRMKTDVTLYRDGNLAVSAYTESRHPTEGLRGHIFVVAVDDQQRAHWTSQEFQCTTRGSVIDLFTPSRGTDAFFQQFPEPVGRLTHRLDIYHSTGPLGDALAGIRNVITGAKNVYEEIKPLLAQLSG